MPIPLTTGELIELARHGAGFCIDAEELSSQDIVEIVRHATARLTVRNAQELPMTALLELSRVGQGRIFFEWK
jgi:hypothetical protein